MTAGKQEPDSDVKPPSASKSLSVVRKGIFIYFEHYFCEDIRKFYTFFYPFGSIIFMETCLQTVLQRTNKKECRECSEKKKLSKSNKYVI